MNANNAAEFIPLAIALKEGKTIQCNHLADGWKDTDYIHTRIEPENYRVKPEPMEFEGVTQATSRCSVDGSGSIRLTLDWPSDPPKIGTKFRLIEIV